MADFGTVDPEDMYVAGNVPNQDFAIFEEIRTKEEPDGNYFFLGSIRIQCNQHGKTQDMFSKQALLQNHVV